MYGCRYVASSSCRASLYKAGLLRESPRPLRISCERDRFKTAIFSVIVKLGFEWTKSLKMAMKSGHFLASPSNGFKSSLRRRNIELVFLFVSDDSLYDEKVESLLVVHSWKLILFGTALKGFQFDAGLAEAPLSDCIGLLLPEDWNLRISCSWSFILSINRTFSSFLSNRSWSSVCCFCWSVL